MFALTTNEEEEGSKVQTITQVLLSFPDNSIEFIDSRPHSGAAVLSVNGLPNPINMLRSNDGALAECEQVSPLVALGANGTASNMLGIDGTITVALDSFSILMLDRHEFRAREASSTSFDIDEANSLHVILSVLKFDILQALQRVIGADPTIVSIEGAPKPTEDLGRSQPGGLELVGRSLDSTLDPHSRMPVPLLRHHSEGF